MTYGDLLDVFWGAHDPTRPAYSRQYRSAVFYRDERQREVAEASRSRQDSSRPPGGLLHGRVQTSIEPLVRFYRAEDYHQKYRLRSDGALMAEFLEMYPEDQDFVDSTAAARVNGWMQGCGSAEHIERDLPRLGLTGRALEELRSRTATARRAVSFR